MKNEDFMSKINEMNNMSGEEISIMCTGIENEENLDIKDDSLVNSVFFNNLYKNDNFVPQIPDSLPLVVSIKDHNTDQLQEELTKETSNSSERLFAEEKLISEPKNVKFNHFVYSIFKQLLEQYIFKNINGQLYYYFEPEGYFKVLNENDLKTLIRQDRDEQTSCNLSKNAVAEIIERIITEPSIKAVVEFNPNNFLINFQNCVLNLNTDEICEHSPEYLFNNCIQTKYDPYTEKGFYFTEFVKACTDDNANKKKHLQEILGYILSDFYTAKTVPFFIGQPHTGKSMLLNVLARLVGQLNCASVPLHKLHERFILAHLSNKKVNFCSELSNKPLTNIDVFKAITGNDELVAEYKSKDHFMYKSRVKLIFAGNGMPPLKSLESTSAFFDRITFILFNHSIPESERDHTLINKLLNEAPYIVLWAIKGLKRLIKNNFIFTECQESIDFKNKYILSQNTVLDFVKSNCSLAVENKVHAKTIYDAYLRYCKENCCNALSKEIFATEVIKYNVRKSKFRINKSNPLWGYKGIALKENYDHHGTFGTETL